MPRRRAKCPPGNLCIDNTLFFLIIILVIILIFFISKIIIGSLNTKISFPSVNHFRKNALIPNFGFNTIRDPRDTLSNPYVPPMRNGHYFRKDSGDPRGVPINIPTRGFRTEWKQKGILTRLSGEETILPL